MDRIPQLNLEKTFYGPYTIGSHVTLESKQLAELTQLAEACEKRIFRPLGGRSATGAGEVAGLGRVFIKPYRRGGVFKAFCKDLYLRLGPTRSEIEFSMLEHVRKLGANAPKPIATITTGSLFYKTWLVMEELPGTQSILELFDDQSDRQQEVLKELSEQLKILIVNHVHHIDFHPGNAVLTPDGKVFLVDFDKARLVKLSEAELRNAYVRRWRRAVLKHHLPPTLSEQIAFELRSVGYVEA